MSHLGRWVSALVDGELEGIERDRLLSHLAGCETCRCEANALRALKRRMTALGDSVADAAVARRLIERAKSEPDLVADPAGWARWPSPGPAPGPRSRSSRSRQVWPGWRIATGSAGTGLVAVGLLAFMLGGGQGTTLPVPKVSPAVDSYWTQHIRDTGETPATGAVVIKSMVPSTHKHKTSRAAREKARRHHGSH
jgi:anti-sigma factor RsiW